MTAPTHSPGPWSYRPQDYDDWGVVRSAPDHLGRQWVICQARSPWRQGVELAQYRRDGTDPWEADARLIASAPTMFDRIAALETMLRDLLEVWVNGDIPAAMIEEAWTLLEKQQD